MEKSKKFLIAGLMLLIVSIMSVFLVGTIDVQEYNPQCVSSSDAPLLCEVKTEKVGFSNLNQGFFEATGFNKKIYNITEILGLIPLLLAGFYGFLGLRELLKVKSLKKVDKRFFALGGLFVVAFVMYVTFNEIAINFRPVFLDGELKSSFPSSHTLTSLTISFGIILFNLQSNIEKTWAKLLNPALAFIATFITVGRLLSGAHWLTDILSGVLFSLTLLFIYYAILLKISKRKNT